MGRVERQYIGVNRRKPCRHGRPFLPRNLVLLNAAACMLGGLLLPNGAAAANLTDLGDLGGPYSSADAVSADGSVIVGMSTTGTATHAFKVVGTTMTDLGALGGASRDSFATRVSADGSVIVGYSTTGTATHAFKYVGTTMTDLGALGGASSYSYAIGISADGAVIVGYSYLGPATHAFKYVGATMTDLGALGGISSDSYATGVSADGTVIVGYSYTGTATHAFKVVGTTMTDLGALGGASSSSSASGVSGDGSVIVGESNNGTATHAFKYFGITMTDLGALGGASSSSSATGVSADGSVIIGDSHNGMVNHAFKVVGTTMTDLGALGDPGTAASRYSSATGISADGSVIVGWSEYGLTTHAFKYVGTTMTDLGALGDPNTAASRYSSATGVSADGSVIIGLSDNGTAYHAFIYANSVMLDVSEWMVSISGPAGILPIVNSLSSMPLEGAHHRPLMSYDAMGKMNQSWATGNLGNSSRKSDSATTTGEAGVSGRFGEAVAGVAVGYGSQNNDLLFGGSSNVAGQYLLGEVDYRLAYKESILSLTAIVGTWKSDTLRGYAIGGGGTDYSHGTTDLNSASVRLRLDGPAMKFGVIPTFTPFASFTWGHTSADAYSETGGSFDAQFDKQTHTSREARLGLTTKYALGTDTTLLATAELIHRFDDSQSGFSGTDIDHGALPFSVAGAAITRNQARFGFDIDHKLSADTLLNVSMHFTGIGQAPDVSGAISIRRAF
jgi:probable HAF family extracellular repeat protein